MKSIKKLKKYGTAVAGTALLVGATLTGAAATNHGGSSGTMLGDYPQPFVDDEGTVQSSIVVGEDAATADVVGAIDIAGSLSQAAFTSEEVEAGGSVSTNVDGDTFDELTVGSTVKESIDASDASYFARETVQDDDDDDVFVSEKASLTDSSNNFNTRINGTTTDLDVNSGSVAYEASFSPGFAVNDTIPMLGEEFEFTNRVDSSEIELGSTEEASGLTVGDSYSHGPYTVNVEGGNSDDGEILVNVMENGEQVESGQLSSTSSPLEVDEDFSVSAETTFYDSGSQAWSIALESTYTDTTLEEGEAFPLDDRYNVDTISQREVGTTWHVTSIKLVNDFASTEDPEEEDEVEYVDVGESVEGPNNYFQVQNDGLTNEAMEDIEFDSDYEVTFEDANAQEMTLEADRFVDPGQSWGVAINDTSAANVAAQDDYFAVEGGDDNYLVEVTDVSTSGGDVDSVTLVHNEFEQTWSTSGSDASFGETVTTGYGFDLAISQEDVDNSGSLEANVTVDAAENVTTLHGASIDGAVNEVDSSTLGSGAQEYWAVNVTEGTDDTSTSAQSEVSVAYEVATSTLINDDGDGAYDFSDADDGDVAGYMFDASHGDSTSTDTEDGETTLTPYGSAVELTTSNTLTLTHVDEQRYSVVSMGDVGASGDTSGDSAMSHSPTYGDTFPSVGHLDTDENIGQVKNNDNVILVGGPAINDLTAELAQENQTWSTSEWRNGGHEDTSILQLTEGFDGEGGNKALVVAGHAAEDTRTASEFLSNYGDHSDALEGQSQVTISTETGNVVE